MLMLRRFLLFILLLLALAGALLFSAWHTEWGTRLLWQAALQALPGKLSGTLAGGTLENGLRVHDLVYRDNAREVKIDQLATRWHLSLSPRKLTIADLRIGTIDYTQVSTSQQPATLPQQIVLPLAIDLREATVAGLAGALVASRAVPPDIALVRNKRLVVRCVDGPNRGREEIALVDVCVSRQRFVGARAVSEPSDIETLFLTFAAPDGIGLSSIGGAFAPVDRAASHGLHLTFARPGEPGVPIVAPIAPGRVDQVTMRACERLEAGTWTPLHAEHGTLAFDGEREIELERGDRYEVALDWHGPLTVDVERVLRYSASRQLMREVAAGGSV